MLGAVDVLGDSDRHGGTGQGSPALHCISRDVACGGVLHKLYLLFYSPPAESPTELMLTILSASPPNTF